MSIEAKDIIPVQKAGLWREVPGQPGKIQILTDQNILMGNCLLNESASLVWRLCDGKHTANEIAMGLAEAFDGQRPPHDVVFGDVMRELEEFRQRGLVSWGQSVDVLLAIPPFPTTYASGASGVPEYSAPPLGLAYMAAVLRENGYSVAIEDLHIKSGKPEDIISVCRRLNPKIVGITAATPTYPNAEWMARYVKMWRPSTFTVIGGAHATGLPQEPVYSGAFDFTVTGEGDYIMLALTDALLHDKGNPQLVPGLARRLEKGLLPLADKRVSRMPALFAQKFKEPVLINPSPERSRNLDHLPNPARDLLDLHSPVYFQKGAIMSSRGCPIGCNFCACGLIVGPTYRTHSVGYVLDEVEAVQREYGLKFFDFHDDTFNLNKPRVGEFCKEVERRGLDFEWSCFVRAAQFTPEMAKDMVRAGCRVMQFGVESGNAEVIKAIHKLTSLEQIEKAVTYASEAGAEQIVCGHIIGHAQDTLESARETINFALHLRELGTTRTPLSILTPYPGTPVFQEADKLGIRLLTTDWEEFIFSRVVMETKNLDREILRELYVEGLYKFHNYASGHTITPEV